MSAGMVGAALVPAIAGLLAQQRGLETVAQLAVLLAALLLAMHELVLTMARRRELRRA